MVSNGASTCMKKVPKVGGLTHVHYIIFVKWNKTAKVESRNWNLKSDFQNRKGRISDKSRKFLIPEWTYIVRYQIPMLYLPSCMDVHVHCTCTCNYSYQYTVYSFTINIYVQTANHELFITHTEVEGQVNEDSSGGQLRTHPIVEHSNSGYRLGSHYSIHGHPCSNNHE